MATPSPAVRPSNSAVAAISAAPPPTGRLTVLTATAIAANAIPIPFIPDRLIAGVRGAIAHDVTSRNGVSLTSDARTILANPDATSGARALAIKAVELIGRGLLKRAFAPIGAITTVARGLEIYALGHLLERYVTRVRPTGAVRIHADEARKIRDILDRAILRAFSPTLQPTPVIQNEPIEDLRDEFTRWIDNIILTGASLPSYLERRLNAAFDEVAAATAGARDA